MQADSACKLKLATQWNNARVVGQLLEQDASAAPISRPYQPQSSRPDRPSDSPALLLEQDASVRSRRPKASGAASLDLQEEGEEGEVELEQEVLSAALRLAMTSPKDADLDTRVVNAAARLPSHHHPLPTPLAPSTLLGARTVWFTPVR